MFWDYILCGIESKHIMEEKIKGQEFLEIDDDPFANMDYLCVAMIINIKT